MTDENFRVDSEERYARLIEHERLERNLAFAKEQARIASTKNDHLNQWQEYVRRSELELKNHRDSRTKQQSLSVA